MSPRGISHEDYANSLHKTLPSSAIYSTRGTCQGDRATQPPTSSSPDVQSNNTPLGALEITGTLPSFLNLGGKPGTKGRFAPDFLQALISLAILLVTTLSTIISLGVPYWHYRNYRLSCTNEEASCIREETLAPIAEAAVEERWEKVVKCLDSQWKSYHAVSAATLPIIFPMLAIYPIPRCSWAFLFATMALLSGLVSLVFSMLYRNHSEEFQLVFVSKLWRNASCESWRRPSTQRFWLIFSLPTIWFLNSISALTFSILLSIWEQIPVTSKADMGDVCLPWRLRVFKSSTSILIWLALTHLALFALRVTHGRK